MRNDIKAIGQEEIARQQGIAEQISARPDKPRTYHLVTYGCDRPRL